MRVLLDGNEIAVDTNDLHVALSAVRDQALSNQRVVFDVFLDGSRLDQSQFEDAAYADLSESELSCESMDGRTLVAESFSDAAQVLERSMQLQSQAAELIETGKTLQALESVQEILQLWDQVQRCVDQGAELISLDLESLRTTDERVDRAIGGLKSALAEIQRAVSDQDWIALSDSLAFEMIEISEQWHNLLTDLGDIISSFEREDQSDGQTEQGPSGGRDDYRPIPFH